MARIVDRQREEKFIRLMKASSHTYDSAKLIRAWRMLIDWALPIAGAVLGITCPKATPSLNAVAIVWAGITLLVLNDHVAKLAEKGARIQEEYDVELFGIPWDADHAGSRLAPELISLASSRYHGDAERFNTWYTDPGDVPPPFDILLLQRQNLSWDWIMRSKYARFEVLTLVVYGVATAVVAWLADLNLAGWLGVLIVPSASSVFTTIKSARDNFKLSDEKERLYQKVSETIDDLLANPRANSGNLPRGFQNQILSLRKSTAVVPDWWHRRHKDELNRITKEATTEIKQRIKKGLTQSHGDSSVQ